MSEDAQAPRRRRVVSRAAGPPTTQPAAPELVVNAGVGSEFVADGSAPGQLADQQADTGRRRTRRQRPQRTDEPATKESVAAHGVYPSGSRNDAGRSDRGLRGLESNRSTQLSPTVAMRAREYAAPTAEDLAEAERDVQLVRRKYVPPTPLQASRRRGRRRDSAD